MIIKSNLKPGPVSLLETPQLVLDVLTLLCALGCCGIRRGVSFITTSFTQHVIVVIVIFSVLIYF